MVDPRPGGVPFVSGPATRASPTDPTTPDGGVLKIEFFVASYGMSTSRVGRM